MAEKEINEIPEEEIDSILDWYDQALANGQVSLSLSLSLSLFLTYSLRDLNQKKKEKHISLN